MYVIFINDLPEVIARLLQLNSKIIKYDSNNGNDQQIRYQLSESLKMNWRRESTCATKCSDQMLFGHYSF